MNDKQKDFIKRIKSFFNKEWEKGEMNDKEQIKESLSEELKGDTL